jgi:hypothetical protein
MEQVQVPQDFPHIAVVSGHELIVYFANRLVGACAFKPALRMSKEAVQVSVTRSMQEISPQILRTMWPRDATSHSGH